MKTLHLTLTALSLLALASPAFAGGLYGEKAAEAFPEIAPPGMVGSNPNIIPVDFKQVNWAQPPLGCVEEMVPHRASRPCPDLSQVRDPRSEWPANMSSADKAYWWGQRRGIYVCRSEEIMRREKAQPGSQGSLVELAWMGLSALQNQDVKVNAIYEASKTYGVPLHVLLGAVYQESLFSELGISDDKGNFSCGVEQINLIGWCDWANQQSAQDKTAMNWPQQKVACGDQNLIKLEYFRPIYNIALSRLRGLPEYRLSKEHWANIPLSSFVNQWPAASPDVQNMRYQLIRSFVDNCSDPRKGIMAKGNELRTIYGQFISQALKDKDRYTGSDHFNRSCRAQQADNAYPLHTGWLLAVSAYNAGPRSIDALAHYQRWDKLAFNDPRVVRDLQPTDLVTSLYWAGKYNPSNDLIEFNGLNGGPTKSWIWFKGCVAQRHVARVMQHVTLLPEFFVDSLEGSTPCTRSTFDSSGHLLQTGVPVARQNSSGTK